MKQEALQGTMLPGYLKKSFSMAFGGGEIWFEHLDGIYGYEELVISKLQSDCKTFHRPSMPSLAAFNVDETVITPTIVSCIADTLLNTEKMYTRVVFVGACANERRMLKKALSGAAFAVAYIDDFEKAKLWLVSESPDSEDHR